MSGSHDHDHAFDGMSDDYKRRLVTVILINAVMFAVELGAGHLAQSKALQADALDFGADAITYALSLSVIGKPPAMRASLALFKGLSLLAIGLYVGLTTLWQIFSGSMPEAALMGGIGFLALAANLASVAFLAPYKDGDANIRSVWLCSRNDAIGNVAVMGAAAAVWVFASPWPDIAVALIMSGLFVRSAAEIIRRSRAELRHVHED
jgi:Co/Zn/Cd efflux system component